VVAYFRAGSPLARTPRPWALTDGGRLETERRPRSRRKLSGGNAGQERRDLPSINATAASRLPYSDSLAYGVVV
jgi:hypothetical protein